jgi:DEAD/DEAH box helicase domain-containing protein
VQDFRTSEKVSIFKAGLLLGLKDYFKGHPDHVNIRAYDEFNTESGRKESYLVMYESIPGGTGYLSRLFNTEEFTKLLNIAYDHIRNCTCKDEGKDGCYKCIYTYANQYDREILSRAEAENLFKDIVEKSNEWNEVNSLTNIAHIANNEESELEERFIDLLQRDFKAKHNSDFEELIENGLKKYRLTLIEQDNRICYEIWPQNLGYYLTGVKYTTRPDCLFKCVSLTINGVAQTFELVQAIKDIVVYLDGYKFHATAENKRVLGDLKIRDAITLSGRYDQWVFSWEDIVNLAVNKTEDSLFRQINFEAIGRIAPKHPLLKSFDFGLIKNQNSYSRFCIFLKQPLFNYDVKLWSSIPLFAAQSKLLNKCLAIDQVDAFLESGREADFNFEQSKPDQFAVCDNLKFANELKIICLGHPVTLAIKSGIFHELPDADYNKENWELFWQTYNLLQFHDFKGVARDSNFVSNQHLNRYFSSFLLGGLL